MNYPISKSLSSGLALLALFALPLTSPGQTSNGIGGGDWGDTLTWEGGSIPVPGSSNTVIIAPGDVVTANGLGAIKDRGDNAVVRNHGTINIGSGTQMIIRRVNSGATSDGIWNINGGLLSTETLHGSSTNHVTINMTAGEFIYRLSTIALAGGNTFNVSGGTFRFASKSFNNGQSQMHLSGGRLIFENGGTSGVGALTVTGSWNGGAVYLNGGDYSPTNSSSIVSSWQSNSLNILGLSSKEEAQTITFGSEVAATQGFIDFNIYSPTESDLLIANSFDLGSGVHIRINGVNLEGSIDDYRGSTYKLFDGAGYDSILATLDLSSMTIGGTFYDGIEWDTSRLAIDGTISFIPEPSTYALMFGGLAIGLAIVRRRKKAA